MEIKFQSTSYSQNTRIYKINHMFRHLIQRFSEILASSSKYINILSKGLYNAI